MSRRVSTYSSPGDAQGDTPPQFGGVRLGKSLTGALYLLLLVSAGLALFARRYPGGLPTVLDRAAPILFAVFLAAFAFYRVGLMRARRYPVVKGLFQIGIGVLVFMLLLPHSELREQPRMGAPLALESALTDPDVRVRLLAAELARYRPGGERYAHPLVAALGDPDPRVRAEAHASLVVLSGVDLGDPSSPEAVKAWRERFP
jgi:hypothetical protein